MILRRVLVAICLCLGLLMGTLEWQVPLQGCAPAPHPGDWVSINDESALIVWNSKTKTEHFVRRASFETKAADFGFLVPTPTQPELGEVDDRLFGSAGRLTAPRQIYEQKVERIFGFWGDYSGEKSAPTSAPATKARSVQVLHEQQVAGFDATVLKADDPRALAEWLDQHGYASRPALTDWLKWYVDNHWIITAFKMSGANDGQLESKALRMSFQTDRPFYPYREPADMRLEPSGHKARTLHVFFLSDEKYEGKLGDNGVWPGTTEWAKDVSGMAHNMTQHLKLAGGDASKSVEELNYLTEFQDTSSPRPGVDEVYFSPAADKSPKERPPVVSVSVVHEYWPGPWGAFVVGVIAFVGLGVGLRNLLRGPAPQ